MRLVYAERARQDIADIYDTIAKDNPPAAQRVEDSIRLVCERLAEFPYASVATDVPNVRRVPITQYPYTIFYRVEANVDTIEIARVIHAARVKNLGKLPEVD